MLSSNSVADLIGSTPLIRLNRVVGRAVYAKCEFMNPTHSVKDRIALAMIESALSSGKITTNSKIVEPTSGNTGIALASICASMGIELTLTMPESMSLERRQILSAFGAKLILTDAKLGMSGAVQKARDLAGEGYTMLSQFENPANPKAHEKTTAEEIWAQTDGKIDIFVAGVGTGGTLMGVAKALKRRNKDLMVVAVEPYSSAVLSGDGPSPHKIQGIGAGFVPKILDTTIYDEIIKVTNEDAINMARDIAKKEGLMVGISSGANVFAANLLASRSDTSCVVTMLCDTGERYLSAGLYKDE